MDHVEKLNQHTSQKDYAKGFGGKYGVESKDRQDKSSLGYDYQAKLEQHSSQKGWFKQRVIIHLALYVM